MANPVRNKMAKVILGLIVIGTLFVPFATLANAQEQFPNTILVGTNQQAQVHEIVLKATQDPSTGQAAAVSGFTIGLTNVISSPVGSQISVFSTDNTLTIVEAKLMTTATTNQLLDLPRIGPNSFTLAGLAQGVYTLDVVTQKGNSRAAYEGILVIQPAGQTAIPPQIQQIIQQQITQKTSVKTDVRIVFEKPKGIDKERICLFTPNHPECAPDEEGNCPDGWSMNEDERCFPVNIDCPSGYWRADEDETGACVPLPEPEPELRYCPTGTEAASSSSLEDDCPPLVQPGSECPEGTVPSEGGGCQPFMPSPPPGPEPEPEPGPGEGDQGDDSNDGSSGDEGGSSGNEGGDEGRDGNDSGGDGNGDGGVPSLFGP